MSEDTASRAGPRILGRLVDERHRAHDGLVVEVWRRRPLAPDERLASGRTGPDGALDLELPSPPALDRLSPSRVELHVLDRAGVRTLLAAPLRRWPRRRHDVGDVLVPAREATGWLATDGGEEGVRWVSRGNLVEPLIDGERTFAAILHAIENARRRVDLVQLLLKPDVRLAFGGGLRADRGERLLVDAVLDASARGVDVRVLLNENLVVPDDVDEAREALRGAPGPGRVLVRGYPMSPGVLHAKLVLVDEREAFLVGQPFQRKFWDAREHRLEDERRGPTLPVHDVSCRLVGPAVRDVAELFVALWNVRADAEGPAADRLPEAAPQPPAGDVGLQVTATLPRGLLDRRGATTALESYERALAAAEELVYVETQYFTCERVLRALSRALDAKPDLEMVLVVNEHMDIPTYDQTQARRIADLGWPGRPRLGVYSLWRAGRRGGRSGVRPVYAHSKVAVVDDRWATIGSANLDGISLWGGAELGVPQTRNIEQNLAILDGIEGAPRTGLAARLRCDLWAEFLGGGPEEYLRRPAGGWLSVWEEAARANARRLERGEPPARGLAVRHGELPRGVAVFDPMTILHPP